MYSYLFYIILWVVALILTIPVIFVGIIYIFMSNKTKKGGMEGNIKDMVKMIKGIKSEAEFKSALAEFKSKYKICKDEKNIDVWLNCIRDLGHVSYWDTEAVGKFGQELESVNPTNAKKISTAIATALKTKEKK